MERAKLERPIPRSKTVAPSVLRGNIRCVSLSHLCGPRRRCLVLPFLLPVDFSTFALVYLLLDLWLVASVVLAGVAIYSGRFLQRMLPLIGMQEEPTFLIQVFAGLCVFSALALIGSLFFVSGGLLVALAVFPFVVTPLVGVFAFGRVFKLGTRLDRLQHPVQPLIPSL